MLPSRRPLHLPPVWCCPPAAPSTCRLSGIALQLLCPPAHPHPPGRPGLPLSLCAPNGLGWIQHRSMATWRRTGELSGTDGRQRGCRWWREATSIRQHQQGRSGDGKPEAAEVVSTAPSPLLKAGSALLFNESSCSQSSRFTGRERKGPCHRQTC